MKLKVTKFGKKNKLKNILKATHKTDNNFKRHFKKK